MFRCDALWILPRKIKQHRAMFRCDALWILPREALKSVSRFGIHHEAYDCVITRHNLLPCTSRMAHPFVPL
jgi:hypothetical protein